MTCPNVITSTLLSHRTCNIRQCLTDTSKYPSTCEQLINGPGKKGSLSPSPSPTTCQDKYLADQLEVDDAAPISGNEFHAAVLEINNSAVKTPAMRLWAAYLASSFKIAPQFLARNCTSPVRN